LNELLLRNGHPLIANWAAGPEHWAAGPQLDSRHRDGTLEGDSSQVLASRTNNQTSLAVSGLSTGLLDSQNLFKVFFRR
jgi:hypothetical protein